MNLEQTDRVKDLIVQVSKFMDDHIWPAEEIYSSQMISFREEGNPWRVPPVIEELKTKAKAQGLWNFFLPESQNGFGLTNLEYAPLAEIMGQIGFASEVFNCSAPDSGNMEVLDKYKENLDAQNVSACRYSSSRPPRPQPRRLTWTLARSAILSRRLMCAGMSE